MFKIHLKNSILFTIVVMLIVLSMFLSTSAAEQFLKMGLDGSDLHSLFPRDSTQSQDGVIRVAVYEKLADYRTPGTITEDLVPELAVSWEASDDFKVWTFHLREGVQFHKGYGEMTAEDVKFNFDQAADPKVSSSAAKPQYRDVEEVKVLDKYTVQVFLASSDARYVGKISQDSLGLSIVSKKAYEELGDDMKTNPVGTGPFEFEEYQPMAYTKVVRFEDYWGEKAKLDGFIVNYMPQQTSRDIALKNGDVHFIAGESEVTWEQGMRQAGMIVDQLGPGFSSMLFFNPDVKPLDNKLVREAICYAIDREEIACYFGSEPQISPVPPTWLFHTTEGVKRYDYNPEKAKEKLAEAGYPDGFTIGPEYVSERLSYKARLEMIQAQLAKVGINLKLVGVDHTTYHSNQYKGIQPLPLFGNGDYDGQNLFFLFFHSTSPRTNFSKYDKIDDLLDSSIGKSFEEIEKIIHEAQRIVTEDAVVYGITGGLQPMARRPELVLGYEPKATLIACYVVTADTYIKE